MWRKTKDLIGRLILWLSIRMMELIAPLLIKTQRGQDTPSCLPIQSPEDPHLKEIERKTSSVAMEEQKTVSLLPSFKAFPLSGPYPGYVLCVLVEDDATRQHAWVPYLLCPRLSEVTYH